MTDAELRARMEASLVASWRALADAVPGARVAGRAAIFPDEPQRSIYNNALAGPAAVDADGALAAYAAAGVDRFALWIDEDDRAAADALRARGLRLDDATRAMALDLAPWSGPRPALDLAPGDLDAGVAINGLPAGLLAGAPFGVAVARADGRPAATAMWLDHDGDRTIFSVATLPAARGRGLATALVAHVLHDARAAGCRTASLQASAMAERLYGRLGFRDLGRFLELTPA